MLPQKNQRKTTSDNPLIFRFYGPASGSKTGEFEILDSSRTPTSKAVAVAQSQSSAAAAGCSPDQITPHNEHPAAFKGGRTDYKATM